MEPTYEGSILDSVKSPMGIDLDDPSFDVDLIMAINFALSSLTFQLGVGPETGYKISDRNQKWSDIYTDIRLAMVEEWLYLKTKIIFDPPTSQSMIEAIKSTIAEAEFRIDIALTAIKRGGTV